MSTVPFSSRAETFGADQGRVWPLGTLQLLCGAPRCYRPLVDAWERAHPGTKRTLRWLERGGFARRQPAVVADTMSGRPAAREGRAVPRYVVTARGRDLLERVEEDPRFLEERYPNTSGTHLAAVLRILRTTDVDRDEAPHGVSSATATARADIPDRSARWWLRRLVDERLVSVLDYRAADVREIVPEHWRPTRALARQLLDALEAYPHAPQHLASDLRLRRSRWLDDIDPARVAASGASDYDHDVRTQQLLAELLRSPRLETRGVFRVEPRYELGVRADVTPWRFDAASPSLRVYQPDAEVRERSPSGGVVARVAVEYERLQTRRTAWVHIEQFLGWVALTAHPSEPVVLRFVVDSPQRLRAYRELIEAFADYALDHPGRVPSSRVTLAASRTGLLRDAADPLADDVWYRVDLRGEQPHQPRLHHSEDSPYDEYFSGPPRRLASAGSPQP